MQSGRDGRRFYARQLSLRSGACSQELRHPVRDNAARGAFWRLSHDCLFDAGKYISMTDMRKLRRALKPFLAAGVRIEKTSLEAGDGLTLVLDGQKAYFCPVGDDHTYMEVGTEKDGSLV